MPVFSAEMILALLPELGMSILALLLLVLSLFKKEKLDKSLGWVTAAGFGLIIILVALFSRPTENPQMLFGGNPVG